MTNVIVTKSSRFSIFMVRLGNLIGNIFRHTPWLLGGDESEVELKTSRVGFSDLLRRWHIKVDANNRIIEIKKRTWFLLRKDEKTYQFKAVRNVQIKKHLFGADLAILVFGGKAEALCLPKSKALAIKNLLLSKDWTKPSSIDISIIDSE
ncbi:MAG: hypothetical protein RBR78_00250 [Flavobacteriaceae bacterium]|nr:hypothetical protein [Flavobacteriaceae bacterium]